ncbi:hypothetical protein [Staphylococcus pettenkoferi]|uniref:Uncharacterized protein n=1 Tax=Staphylococcus pettenkoferi TaxID=170573 RepID=A0A9Q4D8F8_9STAP|nr:hypothetical protein [Staphylococcus pettenkoferi]MCY1570187.1 hypothetical protein [Staphylococcus pettenkoferi]MCY1595297.1 hypothetical protein [Staphylococcus pettenkoferi]
MKLLDYNMEGQELVATVMSTQGHLFQYTFDITTPEYEILDVLEDINMHVDQSQHPLGCTLLKKYDFEDVVQYSM